MIPLLRLLLALYFMVSFSYAIPKRARILCMSSSSVSAASSQLRDFRASLAQDERTRLMMDALRGKNLNDDDKQGEGIDMKVVEMRKTTDKEDMLPLVYDPSRLEAYFSRRPDAILTRTWQIFSTSSSFLGSVLIDLILGNTEDMEVRRAAELRNTIVSLGPFFIKLGQALSIRPDILSPRAMVELQQLCDKVPCFDSKLAMRTIEEELGRHPSEIFSAITPEPVAAASLGQVYRATLRDSGDEVAVKVQRPFVLETVSLDLHLARQLGLFLRNFPSIASRLDIVAIVDEFAGNFYQELDYNLECQNGIKIAEDMKRLPMVVIPRNYPQFTSRKVHTAQWVQGEKLSQSTADDVGALVNLGVITYLTQLLETGFFHADPHPGNMLRTPDGKLVILDFGLMTKITEDQKYGMIEAIAHLIHRDYSEIGNDFVNLDFIPRGVDTSPIVPALARVFEAALAGGGAKSINFQELAADLAEITFKFPFRIPPYFALIIRAISVLEGIALVGNPEFAIIDEAYPYISRRLMTDDSPRLKAAFRYMIYGKGDSLDVDRVIDMLQALEKFVAVRDDGDGSSFKVNGLRGNIYVGKSGDTRGTRKVEISDVSNLNIRGLVQRRSVGSQVSSSSRSGGDSTREALRFFFSSDGALLREFMLDEICNTADALSRDAVRELFIRLGLQGRVPPLLKALAPRLSDSDKRTVDNISKLVSFLTGIGASDSTGFSLSSNGISSLLNSVRDSGSRRKLTTLLPTLREFAPNMQAFGNLIISRLLEKGASRLIKASSDAIFNPSVFA